MTVPDDAGVADGDRTATDGDDECTLCGLPTPDPPHEADGVDGAFCCRGCLAVARELDDPAAADAEAAVDPGPDVADAEGETAFLSVEGMHCATCEAYVEAAATDGEGVRAAAASYPSGMARVVYDADRTDPGAIADAVSGMGYGATPLEDDADPTTDGDGSAARLLIGGFFGMMTMLWYVLFLYPHYYGLPSDLLLLDVTGPAGWYLLANVGVMATVVLGYAGAPRFRGAYVSLRAGRPNVDLLVALAAGTAYLYSVVALLSGRTEVYFDVAVVVVLAVGIGDHYRDRIVDRAAGRLDDLARDRIEEARRRTGDGTETVPVEAVGPDDRLEVRSGERVPVDGVVCEGTAAVDESLVTGEARPSRVDPGDAVIGGAVVTDGGIVVEPDGEPASTLDRLVATLWTVQGTRSGPQRLADRLAGAFVPLVVGLAAAATAWHALAGAGFAAALLIGLSVLVVSCPCALGLATPLAVASGVRQALDRGIVVTDGSVFEAAAEADVVAFDKTGTLTTGEMQVRAVLARGADPDGSNADAPDDGASDIDADGATVLRRAAAVERYADHPIAGAIREAAEGDPPRDDDAAGRNDVPAERTAPAEESGAVDAAAPSDPGDAAIEGFETHPGKGASAVVDGERVVVGRRTLFDERGWSVPDGLGERAARADERGRIPALVGWDGRARGLVVAGDRPRDGWRSVVDDLAADRRVVVITGDEGGAAERFRDADGIDEVFAGVPPEAKAEVIDRLRAEGTVAMVGDGSNDAPALAAADVGIAMAGGTALATDAADAVVDDDLAAVPRAVRLISATDRRIAENLAWAFGYNAVAIPAAVAGLLNPLLAAVAMSASSLLVVANSARSLDDGVGAAGDGDGTRAGRSSADGDDRGPQAGVNDGGSPGDGDGGGSPAGEATGMETSGTDATGPGDSDIAAEPFADGGDRQ